MRDWDALSARLAEMIAIEREAMASGAYRANPEGYSEACGYLRGITAVISAAREIFNGGNQAAAAEDEGEDI